jgi:2-keto-4-pentenoate hydratase/2-oxohepta-3-ene-1,7-dioic acid hydratase in catechol pathway
MKIVRFTHGGTTRLGVAAGDEVADVSGAGTRIPADVTQLLAAGGVDALDVATRSAPRLPLAEVRLEAPISRPPEFLAIGLNYRDHVTETGRERPAAPIVFNKQSTCVTGPFDPIHIPDAAPDMVDYEGELGLVIGTTCRHVPIERAREVIAGYLVVNDVSVRDWQRATPTMTMGKSWDTHGPIGPWLVTADDIADPHDLRIRTLVNGELRQDGNTGQMIANCWELIAHISTVCTLLPGTIIATGTPAGVGVAMNPPAMLRIGDTVRIEIDGIGAIENPVVAEVRGAHDFAVNAPR